MGVGDDSTGLTDFRPSPHPAVTNLTSDHTVYDNVHVLVNA